MNLLERLILLFSPGWAARRAMSRHVARQFTGGDLDRLRARPSYSNLGPVAENKASREPLLNTARDLDRNNSFCHGAFNSLVDNVVGRGIQLESRISFQNGKLREKLNRDVEHEWKRWASRADIHRQLSYTEIQRLVDRELWVAGEVLLVRSDVKQPDRSRPSVGLAIEVVESERLADLDQTTKTGNEIVQGVEFAKNGLIAAYHIYSGHPGDSKAVSTPDRIPASRVIHLFRPLRPNAVRGISRISSVARNFEALGQYMDHEMTRARVAASFALMIKRGGSGLAPKFPSPGTSADTTDENDNPMAHLEGGMIWAGGPNDSIEGAGPSIQTTAFEQFVVVNLRAIAVGLNMSYELLARDYTKTNFSSARQSDLQDRRHWSPRQTYLNNHLNDRVFEWFTDSAVVTGVQPFPGLFAMGMPPEIAHAWITPPREYVDPTKELSADIDAVASGFTNLQQIASKHGTDVHENLRINAQVMEDAAELGLKLKPFEGSGPSIEEPMESTIAEPDNASGSEETRGQMASGGSGNR